MPIEYELRHVVAGRIRMHVPVLKEVVGAAEGCTRLVEQCKGVTEVRATPASASLVVNFSSRDSRADVERALSSASINQLLAPFSGNGKKNELPAGKGRIAEAEPDVENAGFQKYLAVLGWLNPLALPSASLALSLIGGSAGTAVALPLIGYNAVPILRRAIRVLREERRLNVDFLDSLAIIISTFQGNLFTSAFMTWLIDLGDYIRNLTARRSRRAINELLDYQGRKAWVIRGRKKVAVQAGSIVTGEVVVVYAGEMIPVDGEVIKGQATIDQKTITGESLPVERRPGDRVYAATVVREGKIYLRAHRVGAETTAAKIVRMVEEAPIGETRIQNYAEKFADRLVAPSLAAAGGLYVITGDLNRLLSMVIIDYGTGVRVAAPTSVLAVMIDAARHGVLIKGGSQLEKLNKVDTIVFDKTGTLTEGQPRVVDIISYDERIFSKEKILSLAAAAEARLTHPVAQAILAKARETGVHVPERTESKYHIGLGVEVLSEGYHVRVGSERFMREHGVSLDRALTDLRWQNDHGYSVLLLAVDGKLGGLISYADQIRVESSAVIKTLHNRGFRNLVMMTGDNGAVGRRVGQSLGLDHVYSDVFPAEKAELVQKLQKEGHVVAMVGDGINDSPALAHADVGIAMRNGADIAREAADVVLMEENLWKIINAFDASKEAMKLIHQNYAIIGVMNTFAYALAIPSGLVTPGLTTLISNGSTILAGLNAMRPILRN